MKGRCFNVHIKRNFKNISSYSFIFGFNYILYMHGVIDRVLDVVFVRGERGGRGDGVLF